MKIILYLSLSLFIMSVSHSKDKNIDCATEISFLKKMKCKASNLKSKNFLKGTIEYQKKAFEKNDNNNQ